MTLKEQYKRARKNYLARVRNLADQGFMIEPIKIVKRPTKASINRLNRQTAKYMREHNPLVNLSTGEVVTKNRLKVARQQGKVTRELRKFKNQVNQAIQSNSQRIQTSGSKGYKTAVEYWGNMPKETDLVISNWYKSINEDFVPAIRETLAEFTSVLYNENPDAFAKLLREQPDLFPQPTYEAVASIRQKFSIIGEKIALSDEARSKYNQLLEDVNNYNEGIGYGEE